jgi:hypothetical protein
LREEGVDGGALSDALGLAQERTIAALAWARGDVTLAGLTDFRAADVLDLVPRITIAADAGRPRYAPRIEARLRGDVTLEWEERDAADAYLLTWDTACDMASVLSTEVGVAPEDTQRLVAAVRELGAASGLRNVVGAMRAACRAAASRTVGQPVSR